MTPCTICGLTEPEEHEDHVCPTGFADSIAKQIGVPLAEWAGKCHGISMLVAPLVGGVVRRGNFLGEVHELSYFGRINSGAFQQHSWVELPDGRVLDPTRHAFTEDDDESPYLWTGPADDYDIGGCELRGPAGPPPDPWEGDNDKILEVSSLTYFTDLLGVQADGIMAGFDDEDERSEGWIMVSFKQCMWLANLPVLEREGPGILNRFFAAELYEALAKAGQRALIPIDRWDWIMGEEV